MSLHIYKGKVTSIKVKLPLSLVQPPPPPQHDMAWKKRDNCSRKAKQEEEERWGSVEDRRFNELVTDGTINMKKNATLHEIDKIGGKHFRGRSNRTFRNHYRCIAAKLRLERKLAGGRRRIAGKTVQSYCFFGREILTSSSLISPLARNRRFGP